MRSLVRGGGYGGIPAVVHIACAVLAPSVARVGPLPDCLAIASPISNRRNSCARRTQPFERPILLVRSGASRATSNLTERRAFRSDTRRSTAFSCLNRSLTAFVGAFLRNAILWKTLWKLNGCNKLSGRD